MDKNIILTLLYDIYKTMLTLKQQEIFELYYLSDLSLREIAENKNITYQAVRDSIKKSENMLLSFEQNIGMYELKKKIKQISDMCMDNNINKKYISNELVKLL